MIKTNLTQYESDLMEVVNEFSSVDSTAVSLIFSEGEKVNITVTVGESVYPFTYDFLVGDQLNIKRLTKRYAKLSLYKALSAHTGDGDAAILQRLTEHLHCLCGEFGKLVEEEHAVVRKGDLSGCGYLSSARKTRRRHGVVG